MANPHTHASHPDVIKRLKRANGHLLSVISMIDDGRECVDIAQQLHAVERAISQAKRVLIQDHIDHCLVVAIDKAEGGTQPDLEAFKKITKYL